MSLNIEYEERVMLTKDQYLSLFEIIKSVKPIKNVNYYLDTDDLFLIRNDKVLRVRSIDDKIQELTLKIKGANGDKEYNEKAKSIEISEGEIKKLLISYGRPIEDYRLITSLSTLRYEIYIDDYLFVLDKNEYNGAIDFDLEIEAPSKKRATEVIQYYCRKYNLNYCNNYLPKSRRAINFLINNF